MSATTFDFAAVRQTLASLASAKLDMHAFYARNARLGMSPRQQHLNGLWAHYATAQYDGYKFDWDGRDRVNAVDMEAVVSGRGIPNGFYDAGAQLAPLKFRKPAAPYHIVRAVVHRFSGLLFSAKRHPQLSVEGDSMTEDYARTLANTARLWPAMMLARNYGGGMGTACIGFQFVDGKPLVEVHDPRWLTPKFKDRHALTVEAIEKRYLYPVDEWNSEKQAWEQVPYWYRRVITESEDVVFKPVRVNPDGSEPMWTPERAIEHGFGFCPVVWIQNVTVQDDIDGEPDCQGEYDSARMIDLLYSEAAGGGLNNCDPTVVVKTHLALAELRKGSDHTIKIQPGDEADYMEIAGTGPTTAMEIARELRSRFLEVVECVLDDHPNDIAAGQRTATEVTKRYESMYSRADTFREQYGERGVKPLMDMMLRSARAKTKVTVDATGKAVKPTIFLPPRVVKKGDDVQVVPRQLGDRTDVVLETQWPPYAELSTQDGYTATQMAVAARVGKLIDAEHAAKLIAPYFGVEDLPGMLDRLAKEAQEQQSQLDSSMGIGGIPPGGSMMPRRPAGAAPIPRATPSTPRGTPPTAGQPQRPEQKKPGEP